VESIVNIDGKQEFEFGKSIAILHNQQKSIISQNHPR
jgi:hypothetical protein